MPKVVAKLNDRQVRALKADGLHACGEGLYLQIKGAARTWVFRYQSTGKRRDMGLGSASEVSLREARETVDAAKRSIREGVDPVDARRAERPVIPTFGKFADGLIDDLEKGFTNEKHRYKWRLTLGDAYCAAIRDKLVSDITTADVLEVLKPVWLEKPETASKLRGRIEKVLDAAKARGFRSGENPATWRGHLANLLPKQPGLTRGHHRAMPYEDVPEFVGRLRTREAVAARALEFLVLTAVRAGEVYGATWGEIDSAAKLWIIPAGRMKARKEHRVPLTMRTLAILEEMAKLRISEDPAAFVFPGGRVGRPLSNMAFKMLLDRMGETGFVPHGFRSSFRDWCGECTPFPREVAEAALAHAVGNEVERAYRRGDALEKRRDLMRAWEGF
ncbi:MAG: integrase arm-type DNA-binding domain-containing protein, partial [Phyllobacteriaceae bacterium]|nr:integrase arm-type DNA-binding domain-containing protein [Phyllobacteriaceae bacterium]